MRILIADKFPAAALDQLREADHQCEFQPELGADDLPDAIPGFEALVVRSTRVTAGTIESAERLELIIRAGAGTNTIDVDAASQAGIRVCNVPGRNAIAVAELTMGLLLAVDRNIPDGVSDLRAGRWDKQRYAKARGLYGRTMGIVGLGAIGVAVAGRAHAFGLELFAIRRSGRSPAVLADLEKVGIQWVDDLGQLARSCDILSFHVPASDNTRGIVSRALLDLVRPGAIILNTSRGDVVDEGALIDAMDSKGVRAGLDVYQGEPAVGKGRFESRIAKHPNVYGTHHIGASTSQAQEAVAQGVREILDAWAEGRVIHCVNP